MNKSIGFAVIASLIISVFWGFTYYRDHYYDSSANGSEQKEIYQNVIPKDVHADLLRSKSMKNSVLGWSTTETEKPEKARVPILMYHYVEYVKDAGDKTRISLNTTPYALEQEIKTLSEAGYSFLTNAELVSAIEGKSKLPAKPILLTFDDGYRDFYTDVYPILKKYNAKATQYVITGFMNWSNHLSTSQLQEIASDGLVEIGAHTVHHTWLKGQSLKTVSSEVLQSKEMLEGIIGKPVVSFAYPFGAFDKQSIQIVRAMGFTSAVSTIPGIDQAEENVFFLFRLRPGGRTGKELLRWLDEKMSH